MNNLPDWPPHTDPRTARRAELLASLDGDPPGPVYAATAHAFASPDTWPIQPALATSRPWAFTPADPAPFGSQFPVTNDPAVDPPDPLGGAVQSDDGLPRRFTLDRYADPSGISGCGRVAYGLMWADGRVITRWLGTTTGVTQVCVWDCLDDLLRIHAHGGRTAVTWIDPPNTPSRP